MGLVIFPMIPFKMRGSLMCRHGGSEHGGCPSVVSLVQEVSWVLFNSMGAGMRTAAEQEDISRWIIHCFGTLSEDFSLFKFIPFTKFMRLEFCTEFYKSFNRGVFSRPRTNFNSFCRVRSRGRRPARSQADSNGSVRGWGGPAVGRLAKRKRERFNC